MFQYFFWPMCRCYKQIEILGTLKVSYRIRILKVRIQVDNSSLYLNIKERILHGLSEWSAS